jgi:hypothetical protein
MTHAVVDAASATALAAVMPQGASRGARAARRAEAFALALKAGVLAQLRASGHADVATELERDGEWLLMCLPGYFESLRAAGDAVEHIVVLVSKCAYGQKLAMIDRPYRDRLEALNMASGRKTIWLDFASNVLFCMAAKASAELNAAAGGPCHGTPVADMRAFGYVLAKLMAIINSVVPVEQVINTSRNASIELLQREMQRAGLPNELRTNVKQGLHWHRFNAAKFDAESVAVAFGVLLRVVPHLRARGVDLGLGQTVKGAFALVWAKLTLELRRTCRSTLTDAHVKMIEDNDENPNCIVIFICDIYGIIHIYIIIFMEARKNGTLEQLKVDNPTAYKVGSNFCAAQVERQRREKAEAREAAAAAAEGLLSLLSLDHQPTEQELEDQAELDHRAARRVAVAHQLGFKTRSRKAKCVAAVKAAAAGLLALLVADAPPGEEAQT